MAGLFGVLDVAARGLDANQRGVRVAGHNIANVNTPGYSRQRQVLEASRPIERGDGHLGTGVRQTTVERAHDAFLEAQLRSQAASSGAIAPQARALSLVEEVLNEQGGDGVGAALSRLYAAFSDLATASTPGQPTEREGVRSSARTLIDTLHGADAQLRDLQRSTDQAIRRSVPEINDLLRRIADLNGEIVRQELSAPANDLRDARGLLLRELSEKIGIETRTEENGAVVVTLPGGLPLVEGGRARTLEAVSDPTHPFDVSFAAVIFRDGATQRDVSDQIGSGELGGMLRVRDDLIPSAIRALDSVAYNLVATVNAVHGAGTGLDGTSGDFFVAPATVEDAAANLALDPAIAASGDAIAAGLGPAPGDNRNALALAALRDAAAPIFLPGDPPGPASGPTRTLLEHTSAIVADVGQQARTLEGAYAQQATVLETLESRRDAVAGVSLDEEVADLVQLQAAFQANARVIGVVNALLDDVIGLL